MALPIMWRTIMLDLKAASLYVRLNKQERYVLCLCFIINHNNDTSGSRGWLITASRFC